MTFFRSKTLLLKLLQFQLALSTLFPGATVEFKPSDIPVETVLSEEGHQVSTE